MKNNIKFENITKQFDNLVKEEKLNINSIEELMLNDMKTTKNYKKNILKNLFKVM
jgi:hypothetical protein